MRTASERVRHYLAVAGLLMVALTSVHAAVAQRPDAGRLYEIRYAQTFIHLTGSPEITADSAAFRTKLQAGLRHEGIHVDEPPFKNPPAVVEYACTMAKMLDGAEAYECALTVQRQVALDDLPSAIRAKRWPAFAAPVWSSRHVLPSFIDSTELRRALLADLTERLEQLVNDWLVANPR